MIVLVLPSYWNKDSPFDPRPKDALLPEGKCEGNTSTTNLYITLIASNEINEFKNIATVQ